MKLMLRFKIGALFAFALGINSFAQQPKIALTENPNTHEKCGFNERHQKLLQSDPTYALKREQEERHIANFERNPNMDKAVLSIPVVVHVIHTGQAIGVGANISDAQIQSAIDNLNAAYSNTSTASTTYTGVNTNIQFCLAQRDPSGNPTSGIVRVNGSSLAGYSTGGVGTGGAADVDVKALSKWDNTKYYNFWIVTEIDNNNGGSGTQGYAYFPGAGPTLDGAIMLYNAFGYDPTGSLGYNLKSYTNRNVTPVHEVGHALNLYHTFEGDGSGSSCPSAGNNCGSGVGDCVSDTPVHKRSNSDCVTATNTCTGTSSSLHIHNFMDYSSDACQTEFTAGQSTRMNATLTTGGLRASLTLSDGCNPVYANDVSVTGIVAPSGSYCLTTFSPQVNLKNVGTATMTSATITYNIDGGTNQVFNWVGSLVSGASEVVTLNSMTTTSGAHTFNATSTQPNGVADQYAVNNTKAQAFTISASSSLPFLEDFEGSFPPASWSVVSADVYAGDPWDTDPSIRQWEKRAVTQQSSGVAGNAAAINYVAYGYNTGSIDELISPAINLTTASAPQLTFQLSYKYYGASNYEKLRVLVSTDCGVNFTPVYDKSYTTLANAGSGSASWVPILASNWRQETIDLSAYAGDIVTLKFEGTNGYGNNLFIDKINLTDNCATPIVTSNPSNSTNCSGTNTSFTVANSGGGTYQWQESTDGGTTYNNISNGGIYSNATTATLTLTGVTTGMNTNKYRCVITNACGSVNSTGAILTVNATPAVPTISAGGATTFCSGGNVVLTSSASSGNTWSTGATTQSITVSASGNFTVTATASGCTSLSSATTSVTVNPTPSIALGTFSNPTACLATDGTIQITGSGTGNISWTGTASGNMNGVTLPSTISGLAAGTYNVTFNTGCLSNSVSKTLSDPGAPATPSISAGSSTTFCAGGSVVLTSSSATGNNWSTGATTQSITISTAGSYTVFVTNAGCTSGTSTATTVTVNPNPSAPTISAGGATTFCSGGNVVLTSSALSGNTWSTGATTQSITVSASGNFTVTTTSGGCTSSSSATTSVTVNPTPSIALGTFSNPTACLATDGTIQITGSGTGNVSWNGTASGNMNGVTLPTTISGLAAGSYNITFDNGCVSNTVSRSLSDPGDPATPTISAGSATTFCAGGSVVLTSSSATGNNWSTGAITQSITVSTAGSYTVFVTNAGCTSGTSSATTVTVNPNPSAPTISAGGATTFCSGGNVVLTSSAVSGNTWSTGATTQSITVSASGNFTVTTTSGGCTSSSSATTSVIVNPTPSIALGTLIDPSACATNTGSIQITGSGTGNVSWTGTTSGTMNGVSLPATISSLVAGTYSITFDNGCVSNTLAGNLSDPGVTTPTVTANGPLTFCIGENVVLTSSSATGNVWSTGETTQSITVTTTGSYSVTVTNAGCSATSASVDIVVNSSAPSTPIISANGSTTFCSGGNVVLSSSVSTGNTWSTAETTQTITVTNAGSYTVSIGSGNCVATSSPVVVVVNPTPTVTLSTFNDICNTVAPFVLTQGSPSNGVYTVNNSVETSFDPATANIGGNTIVYTFTDANSCSGSASQTINVNDCSGLEILTKNDFIVYPNPSSGVITILGKDLSQIKSVEIVDVTGRIILHHEKMISNQINLSHISEGQYYLLLSGDDFIKRANFTIVK